MPRNPQNNKDIKGCLGRKAVYNWQRYETIVWLAQIVPITMDVGQVH